MGFKIQPSGEMVFSISKEEFRISADLLVPGEHVENAHALTKGGDADYLVSFSADSAAGEFIWQVSYSVGLSDASIDDIELLKKPSGAKITKEMVFEVV